MQPVSKLRIAASVSCVDQRQRTHFASERRIEPAVGLGREIAERNCRIMREMGWDIGRRDLKQIGERDCWKIKTGRCGEKQRGKPFRLSYREFCGNPAAK
ncbi:hypothetical protein D3C80_1851200 [compost metagenome]